MGEIFNVIFRTLVMYFVILVVLRIMGKREVGQLSPFDLVVAIVIAELAALPMEEKSISLMEGIVPIVTLALAELFLSWLSLKSRLARKVINGIPSLVIKDGQIIEEELKKSRYNLDDLLAQLRDKGFPNVADVEVAILETSGKLSIIPKSQKRPVTPEDLSISTDYEGLPVPLIFDGKVMKKNLAKIDLNEEWLKEELKKRGISDFQKVFFMSIDTKGEIFINKKSPNKHLTKTDLD